MSDDGEWHRFGERHEDGRVDYYLDNRWTHSVPHPSWWHPIRRIRSMRWVSLLEKDGDQ